MKLFLLPLLYILNLYSYVETYDGNISGKYLITMSIMTNDEDITGSYFYHTQLNDIKIVGKIQNDIVLLDEYNEKNEMIARFFGFYDKSIPSMTGTWTNYASKKVLPFYLRLSHSAPGTLDDLYESSDNPEIKIRKIHNAVKNNRKYDLIRLISFPTKIYISGKLTTFNTKKDFLKQYDVLFTNKYRKRVSQEIPKHMFHNSQGIMLGDGAMWFTEDGAIKSLNIH